MKAVILESLAPIDQGPLVVREVERPAAGNGQVVVKVAACGVCRSNLHMIEGDWASGGTPSHTPIIPGHEVVGTVSEIGPNVEHLSVGDRVGVMPLWSTCGFCEFCVAGLDHLCQSKHITGETVDGGYAEYMLATAAHTYLLPDQVTFEDAAPLFCPGITAYGSVSKARLTPGKKVAVFGIGGVGHLVLQMAGLTGADVFAVSRGRNHLELARTGATGVDASRGDPADALQRLGGMDASIVFAPSDAVVAPQAVRATRPGGTVVLGINADPGTLPFAQEKVVVGSLLGTRRADARGAQARRSRQDQGAVPAVRARRRDQGPHRAQAGRGRARAVLMV